MPDYHDFSFFSGLLIAVPLGVLVWVIILLFVL